MLNRRLLVHGFFSLATLAFAGCGDDGGAGGDAGPGGRNVDFDAGTFACQEAREITGILDDEVTVMLDTSMTDTRPRDLGLFCGNPSDEVPWARQQVVAYTVPGAGGIAVSFDATGMGTLATFNTIVQVRTDCLTPPPLDQGNFPEVTCFDDSGANAMRPDPRSRGTVQANGGDTVYFVVTGFPEGPIMGADTEGQVALTIEATANTTPTLTSAQALLIGNDLNIIFEGSDSESNVRGVLVGFANADGQVLDIYGNGAPPIFIFDRSGGELVNTLSRPQFPLVYGFGPPRSGRGTMNIDDLDLMNNANGLPINSILLADFIRQDPDDPMDDIPNLAISIYDEAFQVSDTVIAPIDTNATFAGFGEACGGASLCEEPLRCTDGTCGASAVAEAACDPMSLVDSTFDAMPGVFQSRSLDIRIPGGPSGFATPSCVPTGTAEASEVVVTIEVPTGATFDLLADTDTDITGATDTLIHLRTDCLDDRSQVPGACNNDISMSNQASRIEARSLGAGTYYLVVERTTNTIITRSTEISLEMSLRPVRAAGEACDRFGMQDRCAMGVCQSDGMGNDICVM